MLLADSKKADAQSVLKIVTRKVYGTRTPILLDTRAVPNLLSCRFVAKLAFKPEIATRNIRAANGQTTKTDGMLHAVPVTFLGETEYIDFLAVEDVLINMIIELPTQRKMKTHIYLEKDLVRMQIGNSEIMMGMSFDYRDGSDDGSGTDTKEFTSGSDENVRFSSNDDEGDVLVVLTEKRTVANYKCRRPGANTTRKD